MSSFDEGSTVCSLEGRLALQERLTLNHRSAQARLKRIWVRILLEDKIQRAQEQVRFAENSRGERTQRPSTARPSGWQRFLAVVSLKPPEPPRPAPRPAEAGPDAVEVARAQLERLLNGSDGAALLKHAEMVAKAIMGRDDEEDAGAPEERSRASLRRGRKSVGEVLS